MSKVCTKKCNKNIRQTSKINWEFFILYCQHWTHLMLTSRITEGENFKTNLNTDHHNGDFNLW